MIKKNLTDYKSAYNYAIRLLSMADYTDKMIENKLISRGVTKETAVKITDELKESGYIDNSDYGRKYIEDACHLKNKGRKYIEFELSKKGFSKEEAEALISENYKSTVNEALKKALRKYNKSFDELDIKERNSVMSKLLRQGFSMDEILKLRKDDFFE